MIGYLGLLNGFSGSKNATRVFVGLWLVVSERAVALRVAKMLPVSMI
ncbi:MAG: hypothetical protein IKJ02_04845 [Tidjanibacter sp.]|nr:hypothetical protein [Tidjanibacter sp.]